MGLLRSGADADEVSDRPNKGIVVVTTLCDVRHQADIENRVWLPLAPDVAFRFFEDPSSMLHLPGIVDSTGNGGIGGTGVVRSRDEHATEVVNTWRVLTYEPYRLAVIQQMMTVKQSKGPAFQLHILETNSYRQLDEGCELCRRSTYTLPGGRMTATRRRRIGAANQRGLEHLSKVLTQSKTGRQMDHARDHGEYLRGD